MLFNPNRIIPNILALLSILSRNVLIVTASPVAAKDISTVKSRDVTLCNVVAEGFCTIGVTVTTANLRDNKKDWVYLFDSYCNEIGGDWQGPNIDLASELPYKIIGEMAAGGQDFALTAFPQFCYGNVCIPADNDCWQRQQMGDTPGKWLKSCVFRCNHLNGRSEETIEAREEEAIEAREELIEPRDVSILPRADSYTCFTVAEGYCTIGFFTTDSRLSLGFDHILLYDSHCIQYGDLFTGHNVDMASRLPYKIVGQFSEGNGGTEPNTLDWFLRTETNPSFCYAGKCWGQDDDCWTKIVVSKDQFIRQCIWECNPSHSRRDGIIEAPEEIIEARGEIIEAREEVIGDRKEVVEAREERFEAREEVIEARDVTLDARDGTVERRFGQICQPALEHFCTLGVTVTVDRIQQGIESDWVYIFDSKCNEIGGDWQDPHMDLASQLPMKVIGVLAYGADDRNPVRRTLARLSNFPEFSYGSTHVEYHDSCWQHVDTAEGKWVNICQFRCN